MKTVAILCVCLLLSNLCLWASSLFCKDQEELRHMIFISGGLSFTNAVLFALLLKLSPIF